jgi:hypothetical protein
MFNSIKYVALLLLAFALYSCSDDETNPVKDTDEVTLNSITNKTVGDYTFEIVSEETELKEGHSVFYIRATDNSSNSIANDLAVNLMMDMGMMIHSTPFMTEVVTINNMEYIKVDATFIMASAGGTWHLDLKSESLAIDEKIDFIVTETGNVKRFTFEEKSYFVTLRSLDSPKVGMNDFTVSIHTRESMMIHPAVTDLTTEVEMLMPSMGHGSDGNVSPVHTANGIYNGKVNFNMTGDWQITLKLRRGDMMIGDPIVYTLDF